MKLRRTIANMLTDNRVNGAYHSANSINDVEQEYDYFNQQNLGTYSQDSKTLRSRKDIYSMWELMQKDPQVAESLNLHVTAALGGHETTGEMIFISPHERIRGGGVRAKALRKKVEQASRIIAPMINEYVVALTRQAISYGDSYARVYSDKHNGVTGLMCNVHTRPPLIMPFEQGGKTIGFHALENESLDKTVAKLSPRQMLRVRMPRIEHVPQVDFMVWKDRTILEHDNRADTPIMPSEVGGSFLYPVEDAWRDVTIARAGFNNQQIADSVKQAFLTINMESMPASQRKGYRSALETTLKNYKDRVTSAFDGGEALHGTQYHVLPQWGDKQILQSVGDMSQRMTPLTEGPLMMSLRRLAGGLGTDMALIGWADMLAGGLGDGAAFHTSAQMMRRTALIRPAIIRFCNELMALHWGLKHDEAFEEKDYPWQFDFYSDQGAAATEALTNKQMRANTLAIMAQSIMALKEAGLSPETNIVLLEDVFGADAGLAMRIAKDISAGTLDPNNMGGEHQSPAHEKSDDQPFDDDELPDGLILPDDED